MSSLIKKDKGKILTIVGLGVMILLVLTKVVPTSQMAQYSLFVGLAFFFIVEAVEKTPDRESGLRFNTLFVDLKKPGVLLWTVLPIVTAIGWIIVGSIIFGNQYVSHVFGRTSSILSFNQIPLLIVQMTFAALGEEIAFRGFFIGKGMKLFPYWLCAVASSVTFAAAHIAVGDIGVVVFDILGIFIDGLIYATIYRKSDNCLISTIAHLLSNTSAVAFMFLFF